MNRYEQEYVTEFAYLLGTMHNEYGNIIDQFPPSIIENQDPIKVFNDFVVFMVSKFLASKSKDYMSFIKENISDVKKEFVDLPKENRWKNIDNVGLAYYYELEPYEKVHLSDFEILNSINSVLDNPDLKMQERLLNVIDEAWRKNEENLSENKVADEICMAYKNNKISLEALEKTNSRILLQCALGNDDFSKYNNIEQEEEDEETL